jgi:hypothetical protein
MVLVHGFFSLSSSSFFLTTDFFLHLSHRFIHPPTYSPTLFALSEQTKKITAKKGKKEGKKKEMTTPESWCPVGGNWVGSAPATNCVQTQNNICVTVNNYTTEQLNVVAELGTAYLCGFVPVGSTNVFSFGQASMWSITGNTTKTSYLNSQVLLDSQTFNESDVVPTTDYDPHAPINWGALVGVSAACLLFVVLYGQHKNKKARRAVCGGNPQLCSELEVTNPQNGRKSLRNYPPSMKKNSWWAPALVLGILIAFMSYGWAASTGSFGFSMLGAGACHAREGSWIWTPLKPGSWYTFVIRYLGYGTCANPNFERSCAITADTTGSSTIAWDITKANEPDPSDYLCACVNSANNASFNCSNSFGSVCDPCA